MSSQWHLWHWLYPLLYKDFKVKSKQQHYNIGLIVRVWFHAIMGTRVWNTLNNFSMHSWKEDSLQHQEGRKEEEQKK